MGFRELLEVSSMPVLQVMLIGLVGAFLASGYSNALTPAARKHMNKVVYLAFTPSLMFASLAKTVTLRDIISWWFMPVNIGVTFLIGGTLGWVAVKMLRPERHLEGLVIATCSAGNLGNLMLIVLPAICSDGRSPFGDPVVCRNRALSYASSSMALGGFYVWTHSYSLMKKSGELYKKMKTADVAVARTPNGVADASGRAHPKAGAGGTEKDLEAPLLPSTSPSDEGASAEDKLKATDQSSSGGKPKDGKLDFLKRARSSVLQLAEELMSPPTVSAILGFIFGATPWLRSLIIGAAAPLRMVQDSIKLLGDATIPSITLILGGNLTQGIGKSRLKRSVILAVLFLKYAIVPASGLAVVKAAAKLGFLSGDPLYHYTLLLQYTLPPAMNIDAMRKRPTTACELIMKNRASGPLVHPLAFQAKGREFETHGCPARYSRPGWGYGACSLRVLVRIPPRWRCSQRGTMAELFDVAQEECSVLFLWTYLVCAPALTIWSTVYMWFLS